MVGPVTGRRRIGDRLGRVTTGYAGSKYAAGEVGDRPARGVVGVKYNEGAQLDPSQMGGGGGRRGGVAIGGGAGLLVIILALVFGLNPGDLLGSQPTGPDPTGGATPFAQCTRGSDISKDRDCRFVAYTNSIQDYWGDTLQGYQVIKVTTFTGQIDTACGSASSA